MKEKMVIRCATLTSIILALVACGGPAPATPDALATRVAGRQAVAATLTAEAFAATDWAVDTAEDTETPAPTWTPAPAKTDTPAHTPVPPEPTSTATPFKQLPGLYTAVNVESDDVLNVRAGPGVSHGAVGAIPPHGQGVRAGEGGVEVDGALWVPVQYQDVSGWVNSGYLAHQAGSVDEAVAARAAAIIMAIKNRDLEKLAASVHPGKGLRFSPYTYVRAEPGAPGGEDRVLSADQVRELYGDAAIYTWGRFDGTGEPIELTFRDYYDRFVYDADFARPHAVGFDETIGVGNTINNIAEVHPGAVTVEYHFEGIDPQYAGMDWRSLRLVLEEHDGVWYLAGIVHDEWTI